jgi:hypothetical protein
MWKNLRKSPEPFQVTSMDITDPCPLIPRKNIFLWTLIDHFCKYVEAYPIPNKVAETCAPVYGTLGSKLRHIGTPDSAYS